MLLHNLKQACCTFPFMNLGPFATERGMFIRVWLPHSTQVRVVELFTNDLIGQMEQVDASGLYELQTNNQAFIDYKLIVAYPHGTEEVIDPYQFTEQAYHAVHYVSNAPQNIYKQLGAQPIIINTSTDNQLCVTRFALYAPNATACSLIGDFNHWDGCRHPMQKTECGHWVLVVPDLKPGDKYKFELKDPLGNLLPHKADPIGFHAEQYPSHASVIYDHEAYHWNDQTWIAEAKTVNKYRHAMSIYEVHLGSWMRKETAAGFELLNYRELADKLIPYVLDMGFTHVELLPVSEHPFSGSWGYQPVGMFAPTSRFGSPDDFKYFVDECHQAGVGVIIDWVPAHFPEDAHGLARFDGTCMYEYEDPKRGWHPDWDSCIYDFGKESVRSFLVASALYWVDKFHVDGLRVDAVASMLYWDYSRNEGEWIPNVDGGNHNYEAISLLRWMNEEVYKAYPHAMTIAEESTSFPKVSRPVSEGGLGFGFKWNMGWMHDSLHYIAKDPAYRRYHHNEITFSMVYAFDENFVLPISHDEVVHGKGALLRKMPGDEWQQAANQRCYAAFMWGHPGKKLNFMGNEIGQTAEWNHDSSVDWHLLEYPKHRGIQQLYKDLNYLYKTEPALHQQDHDHQGFAWLQHADAENSIIAFVRRALANENKVYVICNFTPVPREGYRLGVEDEGNYQLAINTDSHEYGGSNYDTKLALTADTIPWQERDYSITLNIPPLSTVFIKYAK